MLTFYFNMMNTMKHFLTIFLLLLAGSILAQWSDDAASNLPITDMGGEQTIPKIVVSPQGNYYVGYFSVVPGNLYHVYLQRLDHEGHAQWDEDGILVSDHPSMTWLTDWDVAADHEDHAIMVWQDVRTGDNNIFAYRMAPDGSFVWGEDGIQLSTGPGFVASPIVTVTAANNAVFAWQSEGDIVMQKLSPDGTKEWGEWGITLSVSDQLSWPQMIPVGDDDVLMKYYYDEGMPWAPDRYIHLQRFGPGGDPAWDEPTVVYDLGLMTAHTQIISMAGDGDEGLYIAWHEYSMSGTAATARMQHVNAEGEIQFEQNGVILSGNHGNNQFYPQVASPGGDDHVYVYWREVTGDQNFTGIYAQKVSPGGDLLWGDQGSTLIPLGAHPVSPQYLLPTGQDKVLIYDTQLSATDYSLQAVRLDSEGEAVWAEGSVYVSSVPSSKTHLDMAVLHEGQWAFAWGDDRSGDAEIYAQNLRIDGSLGVVETQEYTLDITIEGEGQVLVDGVQYTGPFTVAEGTTLTLEAIADPDWQFEHWSGDLEGSESLLELTMDGHKEVTATFAESAPGLFVLSLEASPEEGGTVQGAGEYEAGEMVQVTATASEDHVFLEWREGDTVISDQESFGYEMPASDVLLTAMFEFAVQVDEISEGPGLVLYPNPAGKQFSLQSDSPMQEVLILDLAGRLVLRKTASGSHQLTVDSSSLLPGIYVLQVFTTRHVFVEKLQVH